MVLLKQQWRSDRWTIFTWCVTVILLTWLVGGLYQVLNETGTLTEFEELMMSMPPAARALIGAESLSVLGSFMAGLEYGGIMSIVFLIFLATYVPGLISKEVDQRSSEFLLALPVKRRTVLASRWLGLAVSMAILSLFQWGSLVVVAGAEAQPVRYLVASANMFLLYLEAGTLLLLASIFVDDYPKSTGVCAGLVTALFFYNAMTESTTGFLSTVREALPFARFDANAIIGTGKVPGTDMAILAAGTALFYYLAMRAFDAKQVAG